MQLLQGIQATSGALNAEKTRIDLIAQNIANANTTRTESGEPYKRKMASFESFMLKEAGAANNDMQRGVKIGGIIEDQTPGPMVYDPHHPHANEKGMVQMPNVETSREMVDLVMATRAYEANLSVVRTSKQMANKALDIGK